MYTLNDTDRLDEDFGKLIKHYARKCEDPCEREAMEAELWAFLYDLVNAGRAISQRYVAVAIRNRFIRVSKENQKQRDTEAEFDDSYIGGVNDSFVEEIEMRDLLDKLGIKQREVIVLHHVCGLSFDEIAKKRGCTRQSTTGLNNRGLKKLKEILETDNKQIEKYRKKGNGK